MPRPTQHGTVNQASFSPLAAAAGGLQGASAQAGLSDPSMFSPAAGLQTRGAQPAGSTLRPGDDRPGGTTPAQLTPGTTPATLTPPGTPATLVPGTTLTGNPPGTTPGTNFPGTGRLPHEPNPTFPATPMIPPNVGPPLPPPIAPPPAVPTFNATPMPQGPPAGIFADRYRVGGSQDWIDVNPGVTSWDNPPPVMPPPVAPLPNANFLPPPGLPNANFLPPPQLPSGTFINPSLPIPVPQITPGTSST